jgi:hypothetical protein
LQAFPEGLAGLHWGLPDPYGLAIEDVRPIRDEIAQRVDALVTGLEGQ